MSVKPEPAKVTPFDGVVERAAAAFDQKTVPARSSPDESSGFREVRVQREHGGAVEQATDYVAEERPVALHYYRLPYVVMLASPANLEDLGVGFTLSEGIVDAADEIRGVELVRR